MSTSFPFLKIARDYRIPYQRVLQIADILEGKDVSENITPDWHVIAISRAIKAENDRRAAVIADQEVARS